MHDIEQELGISIVKNGYFIASESQLLEINDKLSQLNHHNLENKLKVGVQWDTPVTSTSHGTNRVLKEQRVTQVFASSFAMGYTNVSFKLWYPLTKIVLEATYKRAFHVACQSRTKKLYLTLVGGGVFKNPMKWILDAIQKSFMEFKNSGLNVYIVLYSKNDIVVDFVKNMQSL